jgi:hypothetical protein
MYNVELKILNMIFSATEKLFFLLGFMSALIIVGMYVWNKTYKFKWNDWTLLILGFFLIVFSVAWSVSSVIEGEPRSASMGLVFFGVPGLLILTVARRFIVKRAKNV